MAKKRRDNTNVVRNAIIGGVLLIVIGVVGYGILYSSGVTDPRGATEGQHYFTLDRPEQTDPIEVVEYFSYACIHCRNLEPLIEDWQPNLPKGVVFRRKHVGYSPALKLLAQTQIVLEQHGALERNHKRIFQAIHDRNKTFTSIEAVADFVDGYGIDKKTFLDGINGRRSATLASEYDDEFRRLGLTSTPSLVVADKYVINMGIGRAQALEAIDELVARIMAGPDQPDADASGSASSG